MAPRQGIGNYINGSFVRGGTLELHSKDPSLNYQSVYQGYSDLAHVEASVAAAKEAYIPWASRTQAQRNDHLLRLKHAFIAHEEPIAQAIAAEMGKVISEARTEAKSLSARIDLMISHGLRRLEHTNFFEQKARGLAHAQGVLAVLGPYNFPSHLINAHVIPSLLTGNTVVIKPSEVCPLVGEEYIKAFHEAQFPEGVVNLVQGDGQIGQALAAHPAMDGVLFTGSYETGRALKELLLDQPHKILALELGGKNIAVVMDDADVTQSVLEILMGAMLTTGQRCTATSRVLVQRGVYQSVVSALTHAIRTLEPTASLKDGLFGPMATKNALAKFLSHLESAKAHGAKVLVESRVLPGGAFVTPSLYEVTPGQQIAGYLDTELFGPNLAIESFGSLDEAITRVNQSEFGLSNSLFTSNLKTKDRFFYETKSGVLNINRSTNGALGQLPFGGVGKSGNHRPAGIDAVRYATFPVAITELAFGETSAPTWLRDSVTKTLKTESAIESIIARHRIETIFESYGIYSDQVGPNTVYFSLPSFDNLSPHRDLFLSSLKEALGSLVTIHDRSIAIDTRGFATANLYSRLAETLTRFATDHAFHLKKFPGLAINVPQDMALPKSSTMLDRLYKDTFIPKEKKTPVIDMRGSRGAFLASIDDDPLVIVDAASQIATIGAGFMADAFQKAYDDHTFDISLARNHDLSLTNFDDLCTTAQDALAAKRAFEDFLRKQASFPINTFAYGAGGAEANEIAFDLCRQHGPGGTRIIAFEGAFHGRTIMALHATYNKAKRGPFIFDGYEACFIPFPEHKNPSEQPAIDNSLLRELADGIVRDHSTGDSLLDAELTSLRMLREEVQKGNVCAVIIEPMQCEGGDRYATSRFFNGLRALTRALNVPLIFDEVQTGFHLGRSFFWHDQFALHNAHGEKDFPDCVTLAKRAQLGVMLSTFTTPRTYAPHVLQLQRGLIHAQAISSQKAREIEEKTKRELERIREYFPDLVLHPRQSGFAFAFDMPSAALANNLINQRFYRGFMAYIAGEKTLRFRLNGAASPALINQVFEKIFVALSDMKDGRLIEGARYQKPEQLAPMEGPKNLQFIDLATCFLEFRHEIERIENGTYEAGRLDTIDALKGWIDAQDGLGLAVTAEIGLVQTLVGYAMGGPLELAAADGTKDDVNFGKHNTFYSANITLDDRVRGQGVGLALKQEQIRRACRMNNADGSPRYTFMTGRNRVGKAEAMNRINTTLGAYTVGIYDNQYGEAGAKAVYYRLPLSTDRHEPTVALKTVKQSCQNSIEDPFKNPHARMNALAHNEFRHVSATKLTLSNWATPHMVRYGELLREVIPKPLNHAYFTSGRDEMVDKGIRALRFKRKNADRVIGLTHQWLGSNTAAARSLSHDDRQTQPFSFFDWPKIDHPFLVGDEESLRQLTQTISSLNPDKIIGIVVELLGERSGFTVGEPFLEQVAQVARTSNIPMVFVETASFLRNGRSLFLTSSLSVKPNMVWWFTGGQLGHVLVDDAHFVPDPLTLISTWDGDQVSMLRSYQNLVQGLELQKSPALLDFEKAMASLPHNYRRAGLGSWHAIMLNDPEVFSRVCTGLRERGVYAGEGFDHSLMMCPKPDSSPEDLHHIIDALSKVLEGFK